MGATSRTVSNTPSPAAHQVAFPRLDIVAASRGMPTPTRMARRAISQPAEITWAKNAPRIQTNITIGSDISATFALALAKRFQAGCAAFASNFCCRAAAFASNFCCLAAALAAFFSAARSFRLFFSPSFFLPLLSSVGAFFWVAGSSSGTRSSSAAKRASSSVVSGAVATGLAAAFEASGARLDGRSDRSASSRLFKKASISSPPSPFAFCSSWLMNFSYTHRRQRQSRRPHDQHPYPSQYSTWKGTIQKKDRAQLPGAVFLSYHFDARPAAKRACLSAERITRRRPVPRRLFQSVVSDARESGRAPEPYDAGSDRARHRCPRG